MVLRFRRLVRAAALGVVAWLVSVPDGRAQGADVTHGGQSSALVVRVFDWLRVGAGAESGARRFQHREPSTGEVRAYTAKGYAGPRLSLSLTTPDSWRIGFVCEAEYFHSIALSSYSRRERGPIDSPMWRYSANLKLRLHLWSSEHAPYLQLGGGISHYSFTFDLPEQPDLQLPTGVYDLARGAMDVVVPMAVFQLTASGSYLFAYDQANLGNREVSGHSDGYELSLEESVALPYRLRVGVRFTFTHLQGRLRPLDGRRDAPARFYDDYAMAGLFLSYGR